MGIIGGGMIPGMFGIGGGVTAQILGLEWNQSTDTWTRIDEDGNAVTPNPDDHPTLDAITRVNLAADGTVNATYGGGSYAEDGTNGRVMVRIPKYWVKTASPSANVYRWWISDIERTGYSVHPCFFQRDNVGSAVDYLYVGAYEADNINDGGTDKLHSRAGVTPLVSQDIDEFEDRGNAIGSGWGNLNIWSWSAVTLLMMLDWGNLDSQSELGRGIVDKPSGEGFAGEDTGSFNINDNLDATLTGAGDDGLAGEAQDGLRPVTWRGIENWWGNVRAAVIGYNAVDAEYRIVKKAGLAAATMDGTLAGGDYDSSTAAPMSGNGYISNIEWEPLLSLLLIPSATSGGSSSHVPDYFWTHDANETNILRAGTSWFDGSRGGAAARSGNREVEATFRDLGCRCEYVEQ
jgi:hypothetical protein